MEATEATDWYSWLRRAFDPPQASEYAVLFSRNELEEEDIEEFNHEFLQSMGVSIAKHRLEILKLARKERRGRGGGMPRPVTALLAAMGKAKRCLARCVRELARRERSALVVVPPARGKAWRGAALRRNKRLLVNKRGRRLMITDVGSSPSLLPTMVYDPRPSVDGGDDNNGGDGEEFKWDSMFESLKPT